MTNPVVSNPKDYVVVTFHNKTDFGFTPEMGCMFDGQPINGSTGVPGIGPGESKLLPYHVGRRLSINLAKRVFNTSIAATVDPAGIPTGVPIWNEGQLMELADTFMKEEYADERPAHQTETDKLMQKVRELEQFMKDNLPSKTEGAPEAKSEVPAVPVDAVVAPAQEAPVVPAAPAASAPVFATKQDIITELEVRGVPHDKRSTKAELEKLLA